MHYESARGLISRLQSGDIGSRELLEHQIGRIRDRDDEINAVVQLDAERALARADEIDSARSRGDALGPLAGLPITIKDSFMTEGLTTTSGAPELAHFVPDKDAVPVARYREAGAVIFGKTNLPIYAGDVQSYNEVYGQTNNPWNVDRTPGGSSGGSAAALAAGYTALELGSDIGGSIRNPSAHCGICGHKPSYGIVPALGQIPGPPGTLTQADIAVAGPMARTVDDLELGLDILAGPDAWHQVAYSLELPPARRERLREYRIASWFEEPSCPISKDSLELLQRAAGVLAENGATVADDARPELTFDKGVQTFNELLGAAMCGGTSRDEIEEMARKSVGKDDEIAKVRRNYSQRHRSWLGSNERRLQMRQRWHEFFHDWDVVLLPVVPVPAIAHDHSEPQAVRTIDVDGEQRPYWEQTHWVGLVGVAYLPSTVVPVGQSPDGLPVGIQIVGPFLEDRTCLDVARHLETILGGFEVPPGY